MLPTIKKNRTLKIGFSNCGKTYLITFFLLQKYEQIFINTKSLNQYPNIKIQTSDEATNSIFNTTDENNNFSISTPNHWNTEDGEALITKLNKLLELRSENDIELHDKEVEKESSRIQMENGGYKLSGFDYFKIEILSELKRVNYRDLEDIV